MIQTDAASSVEVQLFPSGTVIKVSENTSLVYSGFDKNGHFSELSLLYGRIRLITGEGEGSVLVIRSGSASVRIGGGDIGVDYMLSPGKGGTPKPLLRVYNFGGSAEVFSFIPGGAALPGSTERISLKDNESLSLETVTPLVFAERKPIDKAILEVYRNNGFEGVPPLPMPRSSLSSFLEDDDSLPGVASGSNESFPFNSWDYHQAYQKKTGALTAGLVIAASALLVQGLALNAYHSGGGEFARVAYQAAYMPLGAGLMTLMAGILYKPPILSY
jgi:hypothetical protein